MTIEHKRKIGEANKGHTPWIKGKHHSKETKEKIRLSNLGKRHLFSLETLQKLSKIRSKPDHVKISINNLPKDLKEEKNPNWKGDDVGYCSLHEWINHKLGHPNTCEFCGRSGLRSYDIHWANIDHAYKRDLTDWLRLCAKCHKEYDKSLILV